MRAMVVCLLLLLAMPAAALRCQDGLIDVGAHKVEVRKACGEPFEKDLVVEFPSRVVRLEERPVRQFLVDTPVVVEEWIYDFGSNRFMRVLRFRGSRLVGIERLERGGLE